MKSKNIYWMLIVCFGVLFPNSMKSQFLQKPTNKKKVSIISRKINLAYQESKYSVCADYIEYNLINQKDSIDVREMKIMLADCYWKMRNHSKALNVYREIYPHKESLPTQIKIRIAELYARNAEYSLAGEWLDSIPGYQEKAAVYKNKNSIASMRNDSLNWQVSFLNINTPYREFSPCVINKNLVFTSNKPLKVTKSGYGWDGSNYAHLWEVQISTIFALPEMKINVVDPKKSKEKASSDLAEVYELGDSKPSQDAVSLMLKKPVSKGTSDGIGKVVDGLSSREFNACTSSIDKTNRIYFSGNYPTEDKKGVNRICIMSGTYSPTGGISDIKVLPIGDPNSFSVMHPAISIDGNTLVFSSDKPGGKGGFDLYYTKRKNAKMPWDSIKVIQSLSTRGNEVFPTISSNGMLYFSSDAMPGLGGLDIYRVNLKKAIEGVGTIEHLDYPMNSSYDDFGWTQKDKEGKMGFFSSDRLENDDNIYSFINNPLKLFFTGKMLDKNGKPIVGGTVLLYNIKEDSVYVVKTDQNGKYRAPISVTSNVVVKAIDNKHKNDCFNTTVTYIIQHKDTLQKAPRDFMMDNFKIGFVWKLNTHYDFDKHDLRIEDIQKLDTKVKTITKEDVKIPVLDSLVAVLKEYPITVEIGSHTDSRGTLEYNDNLSLKRSEGVTKYIVEHGIAPDRVTSAGYGERQLLNNCSDGVDCTKEEHQTNRRTEVKVTGYTNVQKHAVDVDANKFKDGEKIHRSQLPDGFFDECDPEKALPLEVINDKSKKTNAKKK
jgi:outer membrane protein OmpA-like peptidoglycan-associated protein